MARQQPEELAPALVARIADLQEAGDRRELTAALEQAAADGVDVRALKAAARELRVQHVRDRVAAQAARPKPAARGRGKPAGKKAAPAG